MKSKIKKVIAHIKWQMMPERVRYTHLWHRTRNIYEFERAHQYRHDS